MAAAITPPLRQYKDLTHYFYIPLATFASLPQLQELFAKFEQAAFTTVPQGAILYPDFLRTDLGLLNLPTKSHVGLLSEYVDGLDLRNLFSCRSHGSPE